MITLLIFIGLLALLVLVHEFGHFIVAKKNGVTVHEFGFGFPPRLFSFRFRGTLYSINLLPLGGFVKIKGVVGEEEDPKALADSDSYAQKKYWQKAGILVAGVIMNMLLAIVLLSVGFFVGIPSVIDGNDLAKQANVRDVHLQIFDVLPNTSAAEAGLRAGDTIARVDGISFNTVESFRAYNAEKIDQMVELTLENDGVTRTTKVLVARDPETNQAVLGIHLSAIGIVSFPWYKALGFGFVQTFRIFFLILTTLLGVVRDIFVSGKPSVDLSGPVGIAVATGQVARQGWPYLLQFAALLSINLAFFNILPIPPFDGGKFFLLTIERFRGRKNSQRFEEYIHRFGFFFLIALVIFATAKDVQKYGTFFTRIWDGFSNFFGF